MKCKEPECKGETENTFLIPKGGGSFGVVEARVCKECGRVYWMNGAPAFRKGKRVFKIGNKVAYR